MTDRPATRLSLPPVWRDASVERLQGGRSSRAWRLAKGARSAVLKEDEEPRVEPANTRAQEADAQQRAAAAGLAAAVHWHSEEGILTEWRPGVALAPGDLADTQLIARLAVALRELHALPPTGRAYDYSAWARYYRGVLESAGAFDAALASACELLLRFEPAGPRVLSHNDLMPENIVVEERIAFIDFEYACDNSPLFDLATLIVEGGLDADVRAVLIDTYFGEDERPEADIDEMISAYRAMNLLWEASRSPAVAQLT